MKALLPVAGARVTQVDSSDFEPRAESLRGCVEYDTVAPQHGERPVVKVRLRSSCPQLVLQRKWIIGDQALELGDNQFHVRVGQQGRHHDETMLVQRCQLLRRRL